MILYYPLCQAMKRIRDTGMKTHKSAISIQHRFMLAMMLAISLTMLLGFSLMIQYNLERMRHALVQHGKTAVSTLSRDFAYLLMNGDVETGANITSTLRKQKNILQLTLYNLQQQPVYKFQRDNALSDPEQPVRGNAIQIYDRNITLTEPVTYRGGYHGNVTLSLSTDELNAAFNRFVLQAGLIVAALLIAVLLVTYLIQRYFSRPARMLASSLLRTAETQDHTITLPEDWPDEAGDMFRAFNQLQEKILLAKKQLQEHKQSLQHALSIANDGVWEYSPKTGEVHYSARYYTMAGYQPDEFDHTYDEFKKRVHPDDFIQVEQSLQSYIAGESETHDVEFRYRHKDGGYMWIRGRGKIIERDVNGEPLRLMGTHTDITQQKTAERALYESEQLYRSLIETTSAIAWQYDVEQDRFTYISPQIEKLTGFAPAEWIDMAFWVERIHPDDRDYAVKYYEAQSQKEDQYSFDYRCLTSDGSVVWIRNAVSVIRAQGEPAILRGFFLDITEAKQNEAALQRTQKLEAVGQLTGGIAHDFNNILGIILGNISLLERKAELDDAVLKHVYAVERAARRAVELTRKMLDFSREDAGSIETVNINTLVQDIHNLLAQSVTPGISIDYHFYPNLWNTDIDPGDFENALVNLVINARDALDGQGGISIETRNTVIDVESCHNIPDATPGQYVELAVSDNGCGISAEVQSKMFDPFFTTKEQGKGTGLGLAMVYGFVKRSGGFIKVYSELGIGTTIKLYLPCSIHENQSAMSETLSSEIPGGDESLLVVDDESDLCEMVSEFLSDHGYTVHIANNGAQALTMLQQHPEIQLLFTDVVMPEMNGYELAEKAVAVSPRLKVLLTSGYTDMAVAHNGQARFNANLLNKPYNLAELSRRIRQTLDDD